MLQRYVTCSAGETDVLQGPGLNTGDFLQLELLKLIEVVCVNKPLSCGIINKVTLEILQTPTFFWCQNTLLMLDYRYMPLLGCCQCCV